MNPVKNALSNLTLGKPTRHEGLAVIPLVSTLESALDYTLLEDALRRKEATIREISEGGSVPDLKVENRSRRPLLIVDGEELTGAKQDRVANLTMLIPAGKTTNIPVSCVEAGRWAYNRQDFEASGRVQTARGRAEKLQDVRESIRTQKLRKSNQSRVWATINAQMSAHQTLSATSAMSAVFEQRADALNEHVRAFEAKQSQQPEAERNQVGAVFIMGDRKLGMDLFDKPSTFEALFPKLIRSCAVDILVSNPERNESLEVCVENAERFIAALIDGTYDEHPAVGLGRDVGIVGDDAVGGALEHDGAVVHLAAFSKPEQRQERTESQTLSDIRSMSERLRRANQEMQRREREARRRLRAGSERRRRMPPEPEQPEQERSGRESLRRFQAELARRRRMPPEPEQERQRMSRYEILMRHMEQRSQETPETPKEKE